jgi:hypothetical protein
MCNRLYKKLITHEDPLHIHKTLGVFALISFVYRYGSLMSGLGFMVQQQTLFNYLTCLLHGALSSTSVMFKVLRQRLKTNPTVIWNEYRLHTIIFTLRGIVLTVIGPYVFTVAGHIGFGALLLSHHVLADTVTFFYGSEGQTTVRVSNDYQDSHSPVVRAVQLFYGVFQIASVLALLMFPENSDLGFNTLIAIQSSAFLMTMRKKGLLTERGHAFWYTTCILLSYSQILRAAQNDFVSFTMVLLLCVAARFKSNINKYMLWGCVIGLLETSSLYYKYQRQTFESI